MTAIKPSSDLDRFGLGPDLGAPNPQPSLSGDHWVPIRDLHARHRRRILDHVGGQGIEALVNNAAVQILAWAGNLTASGLQFQGRMVE